MDHVGLYNNLGFVEGDCVFFYQGKPPSNHHLREDAWKKIQAQDSYMRGFINP